MLPPSVFFARSLRVAGKLRCFHTETEFAWLALVSGVGYAVSLIA